MFGGLPQPTVFVIDGDDAVRDSTCVRLECEGIVTRSYPSATAFLGEVDAEGSGCIIVGAGLNGLDFLNELHQRGIVIPAIVTTSGTVTEGLHAAVANLGATLLQKPYAPGVLIAHVRRLLDSGDGGPIRLA
jgi:two-component system, LuxR family, response regulator FixJ